MAEHIDLIAGALKQGMNEGGDGNFVIVSSSGAGNIYVQFALNPGDAEVNAEAVSNTYLDEGEQLDEFQMRRLRELGWVDPEPNGNWSRSFTAHNDLKRHMIAEEMKHTLVEVYRLSRDARLDVQVQLD